MPKEKRRKRHLKRQWGKIDVSDLESATLKKTQEELEGGKVTERPDHALFTIDLKKKTSNVVSRAERKAKARAQESTLDKLIAPNPHTKVTTTIGTKKRKIGSADDRIVQRIHTKLAKTEAGSDVKISKTKEKNNKMDIWGVESEDELEEIVRENPTLDKGYLVPLKPRVVKKRQEKSLPNVPLPAVEVPKPGSSYNPDYEAHQAVLQAAYDEEMRRRKEEKEFKAKMKREQFAKDMKIDDDESEDEEEEEEEEESDEKEKVNVAHVDRKLKSQRNKEWRKRMEVLAQKERLEAKGIDERLNKIDDFQTELKQVEQELAKRSQIRAEKAKRRALEPKRLGPEKMPKSEVEFKLTEELPSNLRTVQSGVSLLRDRVTSLQKRGLIEYRTKKNYNRRYDQKDLEKFPHKDFVKEQEAKYGGLK